MSAAVPALAAESVCFGTSSNGRLEHGVQLPASGANFEPYSSVGVALGRTHVHSRVRSTVVAAYSALAKSHPGKLYVYGESGWDVGGRIKPHKTHQNGLSVDFMVPVVDAKGRSVRLPTSALDKFGYDIDFDANARHEGFTIDFDAVAEHLYALDLAARKNGIGISRVIFDRGTFPSCTVRSAAPTSSNESTSCEEQPWIRHDEHYHVDFAVACKPLAAT